MGGHTVNRDVVYGVHSYINLKILGGHVPECPPYEYGPDLYTPLFLLVKKFKLSDQS